MAYFAGRQTGAKGRPALGRASFVDEHCKQVSWSYSAGCVFSCSIGSNRMRKCPAGKYLIRPTVRTETAIFLALLLLWTGLWIGSAIRFSCSGSQTEQSQQNRQTNERIAQPAIHAQSDSGKNKTKRNDYCSYYFAWAEFFNVKVTDVLLALFTWILAVKTGGLFAETKGLRQAADDQRADLLRSIKAAEDSAKAADDQVKLSREALITTERAYVFCERILSHWTATKQKEEIITKWTFTPVWRNSGKTPTKRGMMNANTWVSTAGEDLPADFEFPDYGDGPRLFFIGPETTMHIGGIDISIDVLQRIYAKTAHAYVWG
ncbi:hypothetical protein [Methylovirgula sp. HY1]|uniref:hypothetical protein n=1 Tax=Methylovirgula sp. HY1 TaxID=2822761 RepID=UPI001C5B58ED|nr:hypothetical protein [Methylovirgula sp. HY1]QXX73315.1 hypothetical protein MHY1_00110 [Methylovirgula sp. HY1]